VTGVEGLFGGGIANDYIANNDTDNYYSIKIIILRTVWSKMFTKEEPWRMYVGVSVPFGLTDRQLETLCDKYTHTFSARLSTDERDVYLADEFLEKKNKYPDEDLFKDIVEVTEITRIPGGLTVEVIRLMWNYQLYETHRANQEEAAAKQKSWW
jgi:hypothetical protein